MKKAYWLIILCCLLFFARSPVFEGDPSDSEPNEISLYNRYIDGELPASDSKEIALSSESKEIDLFNRYAGADLSVSESKEIALDNPHVHDNGGTIYAATRSILSLPSAHDTGQEDVRTIVVSQDGTISSVGFKSKKIFWSIKSGPPISSSYQAVLNKYSVKERENTYGLDDKFFIYPEVDRKLYMWHSNETMNLEVSAEELVGITPFQLQDGSTILGSKSTTVFLVDAKTGKYKIASSTLPIGSDKEKSLVSKQDMEELSKPLANQIYITRIDYDLRCVAPNLIETYWNMTLAEFNVLDTQRSESLPHAASSGMRTKLHLEYQEDTLPWLPCIAGSNLLYAPVDQLTEAHLEGPVPFGSETSQNKLLLKSDDSHEIPYGIKKIYKVVNMFLAKMSIADKHMESIDGLGDMEEDCPVEKPCLPVIDRGDRHMVRMNYTDKHDVKYNFTVSFVPPIGLFLGLCTVGFVMFHYLTARVKRKMNRRLKDSNGRTVGSKKKKACKPGNHTGSGENSKHITFENDNQELNDRPHAEENDKNPPWDISKLFDGCVDGRKIGKLFISSKEIAKGSNGTVVLEGIYNGRPVAVKRLVKTHHDAAFKEIQNLIASDRHPNIVRWYGVEYDQDFVYLSLERCTCSLSDLIQTCSDSSSNPAFSGDQAVNSVNELNVQLDSARGLSRDIELWKRNGYPSPALIKLMRDMVCGLAHLHELGIIHRDLKPQNVLIIKDRSVYAKLSDMGISRRLIGDMSSLGHSATGSGSSGWRAPEQLLNGRQTRAIDLFSLGCVLFFCITGGRHPFGDHLERDINIVKNKMDLFLIEHIPEATDLLLQLLNPDPLLRPKAAEVLHHPLFWSSEKRLAFLRDTSDRVEIEDRGIESELLNALESVAPIALGGKWDEKMEPAFINNIGRYRRYKFGSTRDLLRVMRNKLNHYGELPKEIQEILGPVPEGFDGYFSCRFPRLLIEVYKVVCKYCREEECFLKYFEDSLF